MIYNQAPSTPNTQHITITSTQSHTAMSMDYTPSPAPASPAATEKAIESSSSTVPGIHSLSFVNYQQFIQKGDFLSDFHQHH